MDKLRSSPRDAASFRAGKTKPKDTENVVPSEIRKKLGSLREAGTIFEVSAALAGVGLGLALSRRRGRHRPEVIAAQQAEAAAAKKLADQQAKEATSARELADQQAAEEAARERAQGIAAKILEEKAASEKPEDPEIFNKSRIRGPARNIQNEAEKQNE